MNAKKKAKSQKPIASQKIKLAQLLQYALASVFGQRKINELKTIKIIQKWEKSLELT